MSRFLLCYSEFSNTTIYYSNSKRVEHCEEFNAEDDTAARKFVEAKKASLKCKEVNAGKNRPRGGFEKDRFSGYTERSFSGFRWTPIKWRTL